MKLLRVTGPDFVAGAVFVRGTRKHALVRCAPILGWMRRMPIGGIRSELERRGLHWEWLS